MHTVAAKQDSDTFPGLHAVTGCDSNGSLYGIGKKKYFKMITGSTVYQQGVTQLGTNATVSEDTLSIVESFLCSFYTKDQKDVGYWLICQRGQRNEARVGRIKYLLAIPCGYSL